MTLPRFLVLSPQRQEPLTPIPETGTSSPVSWHRAVAAAIVGPADGPDSAPAGARSRPETAGAEAAQVVRRLRDLSMGIDNIAAVLRRAPVRAGRCSVLQRAARGGARRDHDPPSCERI